MTEDKRVGWHHRVIGHVFEQPPGDGKGQGSLACCSPWGHKMLDTTERLNNNNKIFGGNKESGGQGDLEFSFEHVDFVVHRRPPKRSGK